VEWRILVPCGCENGPGAGLACTGTVPSLRPSRRGSDNTGKSWQSEVMADKVPSLVPLEYIGIQPGGSKTPGFCAFDWNRACVKTASSLSWKA
jgi:hypothetical protein